MKTNVTEFQTPECKVQISNLTVDTAKKTFTCTLGTKAKLKRKFELQEVSGTMTQELAEWLSFMTADKVKVVADNERGFAYVPSGTRSTGFQKFLAKQGIDFKPGILKETVFVADNTSTNYAENPFRLIMFKERNTLTLVNVAKRKRTEYVDQTTGEITARYQQRYGKIGEQVVKAFVAPQFYRRLVIETVVEMELAQ